MTQSSNSKPLNFAIIGTGSIAGLHITAIGDVDDIEIVALCSSSPERAKAAEKKYGITTYSDVETLFDNEKVDAIIVCTASGHHLEPCLAAASRGIHVLSEKPLEVTMDRAQQMVDACAQNNVKLGCIFQSRFNPAYLKIKRAVDSGQLGKLLLGNAYIKWYRPETYYSSSPWRGTLTGDGGAALINQGIHTIDLLQNVMGPIRSVSGKVKTSVHNIEGEDLGVAIIEFESGALGVIEGSTAVYPGYPERLEVYGENGSVIMEGGKIKAWNLKDADAEEMETAKEPGSGASDPMAIDYSFHKFQIEDFATAIRQDRQPIVTGEEGLKALALIRAIYESSESNKAVSLGH